MCKDKVKTLLMSTSKFNRSFAIVSYHIDCFRDNLYFYSD
ncbi:hypothetical protein SPSINT_0114 [Staphylococcus pseudintermedius HKU10-03]|nr:hypothetical protein SPSINT_0114 [Staphylococcus pseudintermedius HKU10-03]